MKTMQTLSPLQTTALSIHQDMRQSLFLLQLSSIELEKYLEEQFVENPLLEFAAKRKRTGAAASNTLNRIDSLGHREDSLEMCLIRQLSMSDIPAEYDKIVRFLAGSLNDDGSLSIDLQEVSILRGVELRKAEAGLRYLQSLDPPGIGARDLQECLLLQIDRDLRAAKGAREIVESCLSELARGQASRIATKLDLTLAEVHQAAAYIRTLHPRPGLKHSPFNDAVIIPDARVQKGPEGYIVVMNSKSVPSLSINSSYSQQLHNHRDEATRLFIQTRIKQAKLLLNSIEKRRQTIYKVIHAIVREQVDFLEYGVRHLKPLNMKAIASVLEMHESTISRAVHHKYVQTPQGIFELKYFFDSGLPSENGSVHSAKSIKAVIQELIDREDRSQPLSDQAIADLLNLSGIEISRRTVMKYREQLQLLSSKYRRISE